MTSAKALLDPVHISNFASPLSNAPDAQGTFGPQDTHSGSRPLDAPPKRLDTSDGAYWRLYLTVPCHKVS